MKRGPRYRRKPANQAWWIVTHPDGTEETVLDLARWCRAHEMDYKALWRHSNLNGYIVRKVEKRSHRVDTTQA